MRDLSVCISNDNKGTDIISTIDSIAAAGFKKAFIQWYDKDWEVDQQTQLDYAKSKGLEITFAHLGYSTLNDLWFEDETGEKTTEVYLNDVRQLFGNGVYSVMMHPSRKHEDHPYDERGIERWRRVCNLANELGMKASFENTYVRGALYTVFDNIKADNVGVCFDSGHSNVYYNGDYPFDKFAGKIFEIHLHDNHGLKDEHLLPFDGNIDWDEIIGKLVKAGYKGDISLELCYRNEYEKMGVYEFYKEGYKRGVKLQEIFEKYDNM